MKRAKQRVYHSWPRHYEMRFTMGTMFAVSKHRMRRARGFKVPIWKIAAAPGVEFRINEIRFERVSRRD